MEKWNQTSSDFILLGLFPPNPTGSLLLLLIIFVFLLASMGNSTMIHLIRVDARLHTPMYILLSQLSLMDLIYISTTVPKMVFNYFSGQKGISFLGCGFQSFFFLTMAGSEGLLLSSMAYDRYVAICQPLHYPIRMNKRMCVKMIIGSWILGSTNSLAHTVYALHIPYCRSRAIDHFFCDVPAMLPLACMDTWVYEYLVFVSTSLFLLIPFLGITASYARVLFAVYHMRSKEGRKKSFTTCSTHLTVVTFYYAPFVYTYLRPRNLRSPTEDKNLAVFYTILTPMLNPIIYSLRNKEVLGAMTRYIFMEKWNQTSSDFILLGLFPHNGTGLLLLFLIIFIFFLASLGNSTMIHLIHLDPRLHTPMYILLSQLSLMDLMSISDTVPKMVLNYFSGQKGISFLGCGVQCFLFGTMAGSEGLILVSMAYDRYVAICHPLHYPIHMSKRMCVKMIIVSWILGITNSFAHTVYVLHIPYCWSRAIDHFFCDIPAMMPLACMDTWVYEYLVFVSTILFLLIPFIGITASYARVLFAVYHMRSKEGRKKAFTTCSTHLTVVTFYYAPFMYTYLRPKNLRSPEEDKILAVFYTILTPMLNPIIYSLRNKEVLGAMTRKWNQTSNDFILLGLLLPNLTGLLLLLLIIFIFFLASLGNSTMIHLIHLDPRLHTPMYILLSQLSLMDLMSISTTIPKMVFNYFSGQKGISFLGCGVQCFFFLTMAGSEGLILVSMAYDRYVAICHPLHYPIHMSKRMCVKMIIVSWILGITNSFAHTVYVLHIPYCWSRAIDHFFCDIPAMMPLACMDTWVYEYLVFVSTILFLLIPFIGITASYARVLFAVYHMRSKEGRKKAFTTCSTHLTVVTFYYAPFMYTYLRPKNLRSPEEDKILAVFYTILTPMLNPIIYSLRNKEKWNQTSNDFILLGLLLPNRLGLFLLLLIIFIFFLASLGNSTMIHLIRMDARLHTPMYILLSQLSLMDMIYMCTTIPKMVFNFFSGQKTISFLGCGIQCFFFSTMAGSEGLLLSSMAYDRYVAICQPLHYPIRMNKRMCVKMIIGSWILGSANSLAHTVYALQLPYCRSRAIDHFFCDIPALMTLVCMDTSVYDYMVLVSSSLFLLIPFIGITASYGRVLYAVYHMRSKEGKKKAFTTCFTHLTVVTFYYAPFVYTYLRPRKLRSPTEDKNLAVFYTILTPMLNPIIYSLRNKEVLGAITRVKFNKLSVFMEKWNQTSNDFILLGLFPQSQTGFLFSLLIIFIFLLALVGNSTMIHLIHVDARLHTPMYILLSQLSLMDMIYISTTVPKMVFNYFSGQKGISFLGCGVQCFFFVAMAGSEGLLLASMAYDRYVAICHPLHYPIRMSKMTCVKMTIGSWILGSINSLAHALYTLHLPYCRSRAIDHFFCDIPAMMPLACMDTWAYEYMVFVSTSLLLLVPFLGITASYARVLFAVYHMRSKEGRKKAFTTCSTHLTVVTFYYAPFVYTYLRPRNLRSPTEDKNLAVFYTILTPMLNPIIYSLRNKEVLGAITRVFPIFSSKKK
ncbi:Olfactory receptor 2L13 [Galemys pyrenaicus]|uniref:Olfactory receptor 2L13 n=1 Tax=Galemys pyrenaicus TaxID=202257 RepID=A0A8J6DDE3_GALPY|nr:Olfactory receptor 2L13 [Galemys pyrenaicus]